MLSIAENQLHDTWLELCRANARHAQGRHNKNGEKRKVRFTFHSQGPDMETLGKYLREERQKQGKTLEQIAEKTCISRTTLQAIEDDLEDHLPPVSYLRGFLKLYAQELGLSPEDLLERLPQQEDEQSSLALPPAPDIEAKKQPLLKFALIAGIICIACIWAWQMFFGLAPVSQDSPTQIVSPRPALPDAQTAPPVLPETDTAPDAQQPEKKPLQDTEPAVEAGPAAVSRPEDTPSAAPERFTVQFTARGIVWMNMKSDDGTIVDITLREGEHYSATARRTLKVRLGNPALVDVTFNGRQVALPGKPGIPLNLVFPDCVQQSAPQTD